MTKETSRTSGYLGRRRASPMAIGVVVAMHGAAIAAALLVKSGFVPTIEYSTPMDIYDVVPPQEPAELPPPPEDPVPLPPTVTNLPVMPVLPPVVRPRVDNVPLPPLPPVQQVDTPPPPPSPILVEARFAPGVALQPRYPASLLRQGVEGSATVRVTIAANGRVSAAECVRADDPAFCDAAVRQALSRWRFAPATRDGRPVESRQTHTVLFRIT